MCVRARAVCIPSQHLLFDAMNMFGCGDLVYKTLVGENDMSLENAIVWNTPNCKGAYTFQHGLHFHMEI